MLKRGNRLRPWNGSQSFRVPVLIIALILIVIVSILSFRDSGAKHIASLGPPKQKLNTVVSSVQFQPTVELRNGTDLIWQIPDSPIAALFIAHGCNGRAANFWDRSPGCPNCVGLPEERVIVLQALARKFAVLTVSSAERCWTFGEERVIVNDIIKWWVEKNKLEKLPLVALGASSGGYFISALAVDVKFSSIALMIAEGLFDQVDISEGYPPTLFVHMPKDLYRQQKIREYIEVFRSKGIDVAEIECLEFPLTPTLLSDRIPEVDLMTSTKLFALLQNKGIISKYGYMKRDGRATRWKDHVRQNKTISLQKHLYHHVQEELNLAFAYHEMTSMQSDQIFKWFKSHMR